MKLPENLIKKRNISGQNIKKYRLSNGWTQEYLASQMQLFGISLDRNTITKIELGTRICLDYELLAFSKIFNVNINNLLNEEDMLI